MRAQSMARVLVALSLAGCTVFPNEFPMVQTDAGPQVVTYFEDQCSATLGLSDSSREERLLRFTGFTDDTRSVSSCDIGDDLTGVSGPDGFIQFQTNAEERWRIIADPRDPGTDVVLYLSRGCEVEACVVSRDSCGAGLPEALTFVAPAQGTYSLGIDNMTASAGDVELTLARTVCGNRVREPGEACDDGNRMNRDGCSRDCLLELMSMDQAARELEPNSAPSEANVLALAEDQTTGTITAVGRLGGACDEDVYAVTVNQGQRLRATMLDGAELPCAAGTPAVSLELVDGQTLATRGSGTIGTAGGQCPAFGDEAMYARNLPAGIYFLRLSAPRDTPTLSYAIRVEVLDAS